MTDPASSTIAGAARPARVLAFTDASGAARWRLVANNGRTLGIAAESHDPSLDPADVLRRLLPALAAANRFIAHQHGSPAWTWRIAATGGQLLACSDRTFERYDTCDRAASRFLDFVHEQHSASCVTLSMPSEIPS